MTPHSERHLWQEYREKRESSLRDTLVTRYLPLVRYVASRMGVSPPPGLDFEDILSFGVFGLLDAIERFEPERGFSFQTFAVPRIRGAILDELRKYDWISRTGREKLQRLERALEKLAAAGRRMDDASLRAELGMDEDAFREILEVSGRSYMASLDEAVPFDDGELDRSAMLADDAPLPSEVVERREDVERVLACVQSLGEREQLVLSLYYGDGLTLKEIGLVLGLTESRVSQIHGKSIGTLRVLLRADRSAPVPELNA